jgi:hypothetical protein
MAVADVASPAWIAPVKVPGGKPVTAVPGLTPRSPVRAVAPVPVSVEPARTTNAPAPPRATDSGLPPPVADVVKLHTLLLASALPATSLAAVVIVAVYDVLGARALVGENVTI